MFDWLANGDLAALKSDPAAGRRLAGDGEVALGRDGGDELNVAADVEHDDPVRGAHGVAEGARSGVVQIGDVVDGAGPSAGHVLGEPLRARKRQRRSRGSAGSRGPARRRWSRRSPWSRPSPWSRRSRWCRPSPWSRPSPCSRPRLRSPHGAAGACLSGRARAASRCAAPAGVAAAAGPDRSARPAPPPVPSLPPVAELPPVPGVPPVPAPWPPVDSRGSGPAAPRLIAARGAPLQPETMRTNPVPARPAPEETRGFEFIIGSMLLRGWIDHEQISDRRVRSRSDATTW